MINSSKTDTTIALFEQMAQYNANMNLTICTSLSGSDAKALWEDKQAFFGSILGTLNHIMVGDLIWLSRFNNHPNYSEANGFKTLHGLAKFIKPTRLDSHLYLTLDEFVEKRQLLDIIIKDFIDELKPADLKVGLRYHNTKGKVFNRPFFMLLQHLFNHQTHHRGQLTTLLNQMDIDIGSTDLLVLIPELD